MASVELFFCSPSEGKVGLYPNRYLLMKSKQTLVSICTGNCRVDLKKKTKASLAYSLKLDCFEVIQNS